MNTSSGQITHWMLLSIVILFTLFFSGIIDEPKLKKIISGTVEQCMIVVAEYENGKKINCTATLTNGHFVHFSSFKMLNAGDTISYGLYERELTGLQSYMKSSFE